MPHTASAAGVPGLGMPRHAPGTTSSGFGIYARVSGWRVRSQRDGYPPDFAPSISYQEIRPGYRIEASDRAYTVDRNGCLRRIAA